MKRHLIGQRVELRYYNWDIRYWIVNGQQHRDDDGPTYENVNSGYCQWWKHDRFVKDRW